jgi:hypothetical protein
MNGFASAKSNRTKPPRFASPALISLIIFSSTFCAERDKALLDALREDDGSIRFASAFSVKTWKCSCHLLDLRKAAALRQKTLQRPS